MENSIVTQLRKNNTNLEIEKCLTVPVEDLYGLCRESVMDKSWVITQHMSQIKLIVTEKTPSPEHHKLEG